jgi:hypothetical protein
MRRAEAGYFEEGSQGRVRGADIMGGAAGSQNFFVGYVL